MLQLADCVVVEGEVLEIVEVVESLDAGNAILNPGGGTCWR